MENILSIFYLGKHYRRATVCQVQSQRWGGLPLGPLEPGGKAEHNIVKDRPATFLRGLPGGLPGGSAS